ncbi:ATR-interacting protein isoform X2 [Engraulis encrasicolus]|uniref:ATR-interacting protein isoform X2 n=1 Tax=Engraulis encrasicolus TaxID=184585 RepID=UPI002FD440FD
MDYPPSKRSKYGHNVDPDPFSDDEDFTQDDFNEIDLAASQVATTSAAVRAQDDSRAPWGKPEGRKTFSLSSNRPGPSGISDGRTVTPRPSAISDGRAVTPGPNGTSRGRTATSGASGIRHGSTHGYGDSSKTEEKHSHYSKLEAQQASLLEKMKGMEEENLMKNGEIRVLRDSLRLANQEKEQQKMALYNQERERAQAQSDKEKELMKKLQSLQSELHFKDAEINNMKTKLQQSERGKHPGTPSAKSSPKTMSSAAFSQEATSRASPGPSSFITKETFTAQIPVRRPSSKSAPEPASTKQTKANTETETPVDMWPPPRLNRGSALVNLLLQHPLDPSSLGLCHLLCLSPDSLSSLIPQSNSICFKSLCTPSSSSSPADPSTPPRAGDRFSRLQSLAMGGLSSLASSHQPPLARFNNPSSARLAASLQKRTPGASHLLPLLEYHLSLYCQTLAALDASLAKSPLHGGRGMSCLSDSSSSSSSTLSSNPEEWLASQEDMALASLKALRLIVSESDEAVSSLLAPTAQDLEAMTGPATAGAITAAGLSSPQPGSSTDCNAMQTDRSVLALAPQHHPLLRWLVQLADPSYTASAIQRELVVTTSLGALSLLAERASEEQLHRFDCVLTNPTMTQCLSSGSTYNTVLLTLRLLTILVSSDDVLGKLISHQYPCPFLKVFKYVVSRPDKSITNKDLWMKLEIEVIRFLSTLFCQRSFLWATFFESSCQCNSEVVRTLVVLLHREVLLLHQAMWRQGKSASWAVPGVTVVREGLVALGWLVQYDSNFHDHSLEVMHMYEQMVPIIRDTFQKFPNIKESEELALDEVCGFGSENVEDMDMDEGNSESASGMDSYT